MGRSLQVLAFAALVVGWLGSVGSSVVSGAPGQLRADAVGGRPAGVVVAKAAGTKAAATHGDGWVVERVVVEPLQPSIGPLTVAGLGVYPGRLELARTPGGVGVLNRVAVDDYLAGISEMPSAWPIEALKAQAVAARTYALWDARRQAPPAAAYKAAGAHICATEACQVYTGLAKTRAPNGDRWAAAVAATKDEVLLYRGEPIVAKYSSSNGGASVPGGQPYLRAVADPDDAHSPLHRWRVPISTDQLRAAFGLASAPVAVRRVGDRIEFDVASSPQPARDPSAPGEPSAATPAEQSPPPGGEPTTTTTTPATTPTSTTTTATTTTTVAVLDFRARANEAIPPPAGMSRTVPSVLFDLVPVDGGIVLDGRGFGHGIGLSQWGAFGKAARGMKAPDILATYYGGLRPAKAPAGIVPPELAVAIALDRPLAEVGAEGQGSRFRLSSESGEVLGHAAGGAWRVEPAPGGKVRVRPPVDQADGVAVEHVATSPVEPRPDDPLVVTLRLPEPAVVTASAAPPAGGATVSIGEPTLLKDGEVMLRLPPAGAPGSYAVDVATDLGGGRTNTTTVVIAVSAEGGGTGKGGTGTASITGGAGSAAGPLSAPATKVPAMVGLALLTAVAAETGRRLGLPKAKAKAEASATAGLGPASVDQLH